MPAAVSVTLVVFRQMLGLCGLTVKVGKGCMVTVSDVLDVLPSQVRERPDLGAGTDLRFIGGMATVGEKLVVLLDIERLLTEEDLQSAAGANAK